MVLRSMYPIKKVTLILVCIVISACSVQHARFQSTVMNDEYRSLPISDIALHVKFNDSEFEKLINDQLTSYLLHINVEEKSDSLNHLWLECQNAVLGELRSNTVFQLQDTGNSGATSTASYSFQPKVDNWKYQGDFLQCKGQLEIKKPVWEFRFSTHKDYLNELPENTIKNLHSIIEYEGRGMINLNTGEVY